MSWFKRHRHDWVVTYCGVSDSPKYKDYYDIGIGHTKFSAYCKTCGEMKYGTYENMHFTEEQLKECLDARA